jgi:hypothetical protein
MSGKLRRNVEQPSKFRVIQEIVPIRIAEAPQLAQVALGDTFWQKIRGEKIVGHLKD